jgi:CheY-like chemotaxis protein
MSTSISKINLVVVDDNKDDHFFIREALRSHKNVNIQSFYDGDSFLEFINAGPLTEKNGEGQKPDVVLLDINMPRMTGFEVYAKAKQAGISKDLRFYILTTSLTEPDRKQCDSYNLKCMTKPFTIEKFEEVLKEIFIDSGKIR